VDELTHLDESGNVRMVDVSGKDVTAREAVAESFVTMREETAHLLFSGRLPKGDALASVRIAGIMGAKRTSDLIPLCHPLPLDAVEVTVEQTGEGARIVATARTTGRTGVEMEAMTAVSVAALALYDMVKGVERGVVIGPVRLLRKSGGRSGTWEA
jgi:cyclic pyranopterin phosphate synthase